METVSQVVIQIASAPEVAEDQTNRLTPLPVEGRGRYAASQFNDSMRERAAFDAHHLFTSLSAASGSISVAVWHRGTVGATCENAR